MTVLLALALVVPLAAQGKPSKSDALRVRIELPIVFSDPTPACPAGRLDFVVVLGRVHGTGTNCLQEFVSIECPSGVDALFCDEVHALMTIHLPGGSVEAEVTLFETFECGDPQCATFSVDQRWSGPVTDAQRRFHKLRGGTVSGGGTAVLDAATFEILAVDEVLVISE
jgi:hypothetical protein